MRQGGRTFRKSGLSGGKKRQLGRRPFKGSLRLRSGASPGLRCGLFVGGGEGAYAGGTGKRDAWGLGNAVYRNNPRQCCCHGGRRRSRRLSAARCAPMGFHDPRRTGATEPARGALILPVNTRRKGAFPAHTSHGAYLPWRIPAYREKRVSPCAEYHGLWKRRGASWDEGHWTIRPAQSDEGGSGRFFRHPRFADAW